MRWRLMIASAMSRRHARHLALTRCHAIDAFVVAIIIVYAMPHEYEDIRKRLTRAPPFRYFYYAYYYAHIISSAPALLLRLV